MSQPASAAQRRESARPSFSRGDRSAKPPSLPPGLHPSSTERPDLQESLYNLNSARFEPKRYTRALLTDQPLVALLQQANRLSQETRQLDGEMKTLVYENYSKFITATETIGRMKADVMDMDTEMAKLSAKVDALSNQSTVIHAAFQAGSAKVQQLGAVHRHLCKLQVLFDLPDLLRDHFEAGRLETAVHVYLGTLPLLEHYRHLAVFASTESECRTVVGEIRAALWAQVQLNPDVAASEPLPAQLLPQLSATTPNQRLRPLGGSSAPSGPRLVAQVHVQRINRVASAVDLLVRLDTEEVGRLWPTVLDVFARELTALLACLVQDVDLHQICDWSFLAPSLLAGDPAQLEAQHMSILTTPLPTDPQEPPRATDTEAEDGHSSSSSGHSTPPDLANETTGPLPARSVADLVLEKLARAAELNRVFMTALAQVIATFHHCFLDAQITVMMPSPNPPVDHANDETEEMPDLSTRRTSPGDLRPPPRVHRISTLDAEAKEAALLNLSQCVSGVIDKYRAFLNRLLSTPVARPPAPLSSPPGPADESAHLHARIQQFVIPALFHNRLLHTLDRDVRRIDTALCLFARLDTVLDRLIDRCLGDWVGAVLAAQTLALRNLLAGALCAPLPAGADPTLTFRNPRTLPPVVEPSAGAGLPFTAADPAGTAPLPAFDPVADLMAPSSDANSAKSSAVAGRILRDFVTTLPAWFVQRLESEVSPALRLLLHTDLAFPSHPGGRTTLLKQFETGLGGFFERLPGALVTLARTPGLHVTHPAVLLAMARFCQSFAPAGVDQVFRLFTFALLPPSEFQPAQPGLNIRFPRDLHSRPAPTAPPGPRSSAASGSPPPPGLARTAFAYDPKRISLAWNRGGQHLGNRYVLGMVRSVLDPIRCELRRRTTDPLNSAPAGAVSPRWIQIAVRWLPRVEADVRAVFGDPDTAPGRPSGRKSSSDATDRLRSLSGRSLATASATAGSLTTRNSLKPISRSKSGPNYETGTELPTVGPALSRLPSLTAHPLHRTHSNDSSRRDSLGSNPASRSRHPSLTTYTHPKLTGPRHAANTAAASSPFSPDFPALPFSPSLAVVRTNSQSTIMDPLALPSPSEGPSGGSAGLPQPALSLSSRTYSNLDPLHRHLISHIDRLFSDRLEVFGDVPLDEPGILLAVFRAITKEMIEWTRMQTLGRTAVQQTQLDVHFLKQVWRYFVEKDWVLVSLLDEWVASATVRCVTEGAALDDQVVWDTVYATLEQLDGSEPVVPAS
ncbi:hypothetical protein IWQ60_003878 [Tieghemiomyces parasiticus]|uniref:Vacuolar protein sorting-associated protein 51 homolog n=1 Tax=Tieghemiomyces parasiticus TaxID=78921 RepID=A0A9W8DZM8_9FUNG|nr:hypothetical protein IWQ60_003878 [Tieghemiomyces parasiticus]